MTHTISATVVTLAQLQKQWSCDHFVVSHAGTNYYTNDIKLCTVTL